MSEYSGSSVRRYGNILYKSFSSMAQISIQLYKYYRGHKTINILLNIAGNINITGHIYNQNTTAP